MSSRPLMSRRACMALAAALALTRSAVAQQPPPAASPAPEAPDLEKPSGDASSAREVRLEGRNALVTRGESTWDDGYEKLLAAFKAIRAEARRLGVATVGRPMAAFIHTDDAGFRFEAMMVLERAPDPALRPQRAFSFGQTPAGRAYVFKHTGAYDDIDSAYEAITAWLDEKGLTAKGAFVEEYLTEPEGSDDTLLDLNIYVFVE
jgi:effector-binding domain-containing protein